MDEFVENGDSVNVVALTEKRQGIQTHISQERGMNVFYIQCGNIQKVNKYKKVVSSFFAGELMYRKSKKLYSNTIIDCIIFALPPLTIAPFVCHLKKRLNTKLYLLLKEFWPHDPADLGAMHRGGIVWKIFRELENELYKYSDYIGTMSKAGITFLKGINESAARKAEVCPNSQKETLKKLTTQQKYKIREKYQIPNNKFVFVFGGNLGLSQGIPEMIRCISAATKIDEAFFLIIGAGTEFNSVRKAFSDLIYSDNVVVLPFIPRNEFDILISSCDVGLIFLYHGYTVPNVPSRLVSYLMAGLPILAAVDYVTDVGQIIESANCGISVINGDENAFCIAVEKMINPTFLAEMSENSFRLFHNEYTSRQSYLTIRNHFV